MTPTALLCLACAALAATSQAASVQDAASATDKTTLRDLVQKLIATLGPISLPDRDVDLELPEVTAKGYVKDMIVSGVSSIKLEKLSVSLENGKVDLKMVLPSASVVGQYGVDGTLSMSGVDLFLQGKGQLTAGLTNFSLQASVQIGISDEGQILLKDFTLSAWDVSDVQLHLDGLYGDSDLGKTINKILADFLTPLIKAYHTKITDTVTKAVKEQGAELLLGIHKDHAKPTSFGWQFPTSRFTAMNAVKAKTHSLEKATAPELHEDDFDVLVHLPHHGEVPHAQLLSLLGPKTRIDLHGRATFHRNGAVVDLADRE